MTDDHITDSITDLHHRADRLEAIRSAIAALPFSEREFCKRSGLNSTLVNLVKNRRRVPRWKTIEKIEEALKTVKV